MTTALSPPIHAHPLSPLIIASKHCPKCTGHAKRLRKASSKQTLTQTPGFPRCLGGMTSHCLRLNTMRTLRGAGENSQQNKLSTIHQQKGPLLNNMESGDESQSSSQAAESS